MILTAEREKHIRSCADEFHHNSSAIDDCDPEDAITLLLGEIDRLRGVTRSYLPTSIIAEDILEKAELFAKDSGNPSIGHYKHLILLMSEYIGALEQDRNRIGMKNQQW